MEDQKIKNFQSFNNALPMLIQKDINANILMFMFVAMYSAIKDEQKETIASFIEKLSEDMFKFFSGKLTMDFDELSDLEIENFKKKVKFLIDQNLNPIQEEIQKYKYDKK